MPAKSKEPKRFKVGDRASVRFIKTSTHAINRINEIVDTGFISKTTPDTVQFTSDQTSPTEHLRRYTFKRKADKWVEWGKDCYTLE